MSNCQPMFACRSKVNTHQYFLCSLLLAFLENAELGQAFLEGRLHLLPVFQRYVWYHAAVFNPPLENCLLNPPYQVSLFLFDLYKVVIVGRDWTPLDGRPWKPLHLGPNALPYFLAAALLVQLFDNSPSYGLSRRPSLRRSTFLRAVALGNKP